jgi:hypothetical protein
MKKNSVSQEGQDDMKQVIGVGASISPGTTHVSHQFYLGKLIFYIMYCLCIHCPHSSLLKDLCQTTTSSMSFHPSERHRALKQQVPYG